MSYATSNPPVRMAGSIANNNIWHYTSSDSGTATTASFYYSNGDTLGMKAGDFVHVYDLVNTKGSLTCVTGVTAGSGATTAFAFIS